MALLNKRKELTRYCISAIIEPEAFMSNNWWRKPTSWWSPSNLKAKDDDDDGAPGRGDFEQIIQDKLAPVFDIARERALEALSGGDRFDAVDLHGDLVALFLPVLTDIALFVVENMEGQFSLGLEIADVAKQAREWAARKADTLANRIIKTTLDLLSNLAPEEIEAALERAFGPSRRLTIGASETTDGLSFGALLFQRLALALGVAIDLIWYTRKDERVCPICRPLHKTKQEVWSVQFPNGPKAHPRCRCGLVPKLRRKLKL